jgi:hypothetical protein
VPTPTLSPPPTLQQTMPSPSSSRTTILPNSTTTSAARPAGHNLGTKSIQPSSFNAGAFGSTTPFGANQNSMTPPLQPNYTGSFLQQPQASTRQFITPNYASSAIMQPLQPNLTGGGFSQPPQAPQKQFTAPNYNISLSTMNPAPMSSVPLAPSAPTPPPFFSAGMGVMAPSKPAQPTWGSSTTKSSKDDWGDLDPLA